MENNEAAGDPVIPEYFKIILEPHDGHRGEIRYDNIPAYQLQDGVLCIVDNGVQDVYNVSDFFCITITPVY